MGALWEEEAGRRDLDIARGLACAGIPVFLARPALSPDGTWDAAGGTGGCGYRLPTGWQHTKADPAVLDSWRDGWAVCAVMGHGLDALDTDPRHDGDIERSLLVEAGVWPRTYAEAATPSGGTHELVASLGVASRDGLRPGVDLKAGQNGTGRGFVFIAPTRRRSKVTFELNPYHWTRPPDLDAWAEWRDADDSGEALAELVRQARNGTRDAEPVQYDGPAHADLNPAEQRRLTAYTTKAVNGITDELRASASWPIGYTDDKRRGWEKLQADAAYRLGALARASWCPVTMDQAKAAFIAAAPTTGSWTLQNVKAKWASQCARGPVAEFPQGAEADPADPRQPSDDDETEAALDQAAELAQAVGRKLFDLRVYEIARDKLAAEKQPPSPPFDAGTLADVLTRPADPPARVVGLIPWEASTLVVAQRKTGKTTLMLNLARCLLTGEDFLGRFPVRPISGSVGFLNYEVSAAQLARWADEHGIPRDWLYLVNVRGRRNPLAHEDDRARLSEQLRANEVDALMVDPFGRAYVGKSQNDPGEVGAWLADLDRFARGDCEVTDLVVSAHAGWEGERARGASALEDWGDSIITLNRPDDRDDPTRYLRAAGRDVEVEEDALAYDPATRRLTLTGTGSRRQAADQKRAEELVPMVAAVVKKDPECSQAAIEKAVPGRRDSVREAIGEAIDRGLIERVKKGRAWAHTPTSPDLAPPRPGRGASDLAPSPIRGEGEVKGEANQNGRGVGEGEVLQQLTKRLGAVEAVEP